MITSSFVNVPDTRRVIVCDDDPATLALLKRQLENAQYFVEACESGVKALEAVNRFGAGIIVADWSMPEMDGIELCQTVREMCEMQALGGVYFILLTAHSDKEQVVMGLEAGADDYLTKPYHIQELLARIRAGERILDLQTELIKRQIELQKVNAETASLNRKLERLAHTDVLTELWNRRQILKRLEEAWAGGDRGHQDLSCIIFDVDKFKSVNDTYGHEAGDEVLKTIAQHIRNVIRRHEPCGRFGGEEFLVLCLDTPPEKAVYVAERIRQTVAATPVTAGETEIPVTVSLGVAGRNQKHNIPNDLIAEADRMLYLAKNNGRNQTWVSHPDGTEERVNLPAASDTNAATTRA